MLRRILRWLAFTFGSVLAAAIISLVVYDQLEYQPHRRAIAALVVPEPAKRNSTVLMRLQCADANGQISVLAARSLVYEIDRNSPRQTTMARMRREILWMQLVKIHLSEDDQFLIERRLAFFGARTRGYDAAAREIFGRSLDGLSDLELAELVVIARWPTRYRDPRNADAVRSKARTLLAQSLSRS